jgi:hypothetical protein
MVATMVATKGELKVAKLAAWMEAQKVAMSVAQMDRGRVVPMVELKVAMTV